MAHHSFLVAVSDRNTRHMQKIPLQECLKALLLFFGTIVREQTNERASVGMSVQVKGSKIKKKILPLQAAAAATTKRVRLKRLKWERREKKPTLTENTAKEMSTVMFTIQLCYKKFWIFLCCCAFVVCLHFRICYEVGICAKFFVLHCILYV